jgi:Holliday junction resolvasome RuvABC endonuclease subunit
MTSADTPSVLGIDPSLTATGLAHLGGQTVIGGGAKLGDERLWLINRTVRQACWDHAPVLAVVEDLPTHAKSAGITGMAQGAVRLALLEAAVPYVLVVPSTVKKYATGKGTATKADLRMALYQRTDVDERDDNKVDAWWLQAMGLDHLGCPPVPLPKAQRATLDVITWPELVAP